MTALIRENWDGYAATSDALLAGNNYSMWTTLGGFQFSDESQFGIGQSLIGNGFGSNQLISTTFANSGTLFFSIPFLYNAGAGSSDHFAITFRDVTGDQVTVAFNQAGTIRIFSGGSGGTLIGTYTGAFLPNQWNFFVGKIIFNNVTGSVNIWKNGNTGTADYTLTGVNTQAGSGNSYANNIKLSCPSGNTSALCKSICVWDTTGSAPWNGLISEFRGDLNWCNSDASVAWTQNNSASVQVGTSTTSGTQSVLAGVITSCAAQAVGGGAPGPTGVKPLVGGTFTTMIASFNGGFTGNVKFAVYDMDGASYSPTGEPWTASKPGTLLAISNILVNPVNGNNNVTFASPVTLQNGHWYLFCMLSDTNCSMNSVPSNNQWHMVQPYASGFPNPGTGLVVSAAVAPCIYVPALTPTNSGLVNDLAQDGAITYVSSSTPGQQDFYGQSGPPTEEAAGTILGVDLFVMAAKSDAGGRTISAMVKSGGTTNTLTAFSPNTTFNLWKYAVDLDPNTSAAWLAANWATAQLGLDLVS